MSEKTEITDEMMAKMKEMLSASKVQSSGWSKPAAAVADDKIQAVSIPMSIETPEGKIRVYLHFDGSVADSPETLMALLESLSAKGLPLDIWRGQSKPAWGGGKKRGW